MMSNFPPPGFIPTESAVPGIELYCPAPQDAERHQEVLDFNCPQCGATTAYSVADGGLTCAHCGYYEPPKQQMVGKGAQQFEFTVDTLRAAAQRDAQGWGQARREVACQNCGAILSVPADVLTQTCTFCGSNKVIQRDAPQDALRPRFLIPFKLDGAACSQISKQWLGSSWMTPETLKRLGDLRLFKGVYLPFWTFDAVTSADWKAQVGHTVSERHYDSHNKRWTTRTRTVWRWESGSVRVTIDDLLIEGTACLSALLLGRIKNYDLHQLEAYDPKYLAGQHAKGYDIPLEKAWEKGREQMREQTRQACRSRASSSQIRNFSMNLDFADESWRYILLPVYLAAYRYGDKTYQVMINGQTGVIAGQRPVDWLKVWLAIAALLAPGVLVGLVGLATLALGGLGVVIGGVGFILLVIGIVISIIIFTKAQRMDDA
jgi:ribosomal protein S27E